LLVARPGEGPADDGIDRRPDGQRVGQDDRSLDVSQLPHLQEARGLAETVSDKHRGRDLTLKQVPAVWQDGSHTRADRISFHDRGMPDPDSRHVRDRVPLPRRQHAGTNTQVPDPRPLLGDQMSSSEECDSRKRSVSVDSHSRSESLVLSPENSRMI
jgi:hypothetical protein